MVPEGWSLWWRSKDMAAEAASWRLRSWAACRKQREHVRKGGRHLKSKASPHWHSSPNRAASLKPLQTLPPTGEQPFKYQSPKGSSSFKPPHWGSAQTWLNTRRCSACSNQGWDKNCTRIETDLWGFESYMKILVKTTVVWWMRNGTFSGQTTSKQDWKLTTDCGCPLCFHSPFKSTAAPQDPEEHSSLVFLVWMSLKH